MHKLHVVVLAKEERRAAYVHMYAVMMHAVLIVRVVTVLLWHACAVMPPRQRTIALRRVGATVAVTACCCATRKLDECEVCVIVTAGLHLMRVLDKTVKTVEINFLCVHKKLRSKRLAPVLIKEVTRRVNRSGVWQMFSSSSVGAAVDAAVNKRCVAHHIS
eukprot:7232-Heterococcus_DN1.PRE.1